MDDLTPDLVRWQDLAQAARSARQRGERALALQHFRHALALQPGHPSLPIDVAVELRELGRLDESDRVLHTVLLHQPPCVAAHRNLGYNARRRGQRAQAWAHFSQALTLQPEDTRLGLEVATELRELGRLEEAEALLMPLLADEGLASQAWAARGLLARRRGQREQALACFGQALELDPTHSGLPLDVATELRELGRLDEARQLVQALLPQHPKPATVWQQLGQIAQYRDDGLEALRCFEQGVQAEPGQQACYLACAAEGLRLGALDRSEAVLRRGLKDVQQPLRLVLALARLDRARGRLYEARVRLQGALKLYPGDADTALLLVELHTQLASFDEAREAIDALAQRHPQRVFDIAMRRAQLARAQYDTAGADAHLALALQARPHEGGVHQLRALLALMQGDSAAADQHLQQARQLLQRHPSLRQQQGAAGGLRAMIWRESRTNPFAEQALQAAQGLPAPQRLPAMAQAVADEPAHFGSAVAWLVALRRDGAWQRAPHRADQPGAPAAQGLAIPRTVVQFWDSADIPADVLASMQSWPRHCHGFEHQVYNDASADAFIARHGSAGMLRAFRMANHPAMRSDVFRLVWLWVNGGVYADADDLCRHSVAQWLRPGVQLLLLQEDIGSIGNNFIAAAPGHPFIRAALDTVVANVLARQGDSVWFISGPGALTTAFTQHAHADLAQAQLPPGVCVVDSWQAQRLAISMHLPRSYKQGDRHWSHARAQVHSLFRPTWRPDSLRSGRTAPRLTRRAQPLALASPLPAFSLNPSG